MKQIKQKTRKYVDKCPICKKEIVGNSEAQVNYNMKIHQQSKDKKAKVSGTDKKKYKKEKLKK